MAESESPLPKEEVKVEEKDPAVLEQKAQKEAGYPDLFDGEEPVQEEQKEEGGPNFSKILQEVV